MRKIFSLNKIWMFHKGDIDVKYPTSEDKGPVYSQSKTIRKQAGPAAYAYYDAFNPYYRYKDVELRSDNWRIINVPHDYIIGQTPTQEGNCATGYFVYDNAWYRKHFEADQEWQGKRVILQFGGIAGEATIYLNGCLMKHNFSSFNEFDVDITDNIYFDRENVLAVYVFGKRFEGWWYQGAGIYRDVKLVVTEPVAIDRYGVYAPATKVNDTLWRVDFQTTVVNDNDQDKNVTVESDIIDVDGTVVATAKCEGNAIFRDKTTFKYTAEVNNPKIWDTESPNLYKVVTRVYVDGELSDEDSTRIGFRTIAVDAEQGFLLNGRKVLIKGMCMHQDFGLTGLVLPDNVARYRLELIKQMGSNGIRLSHYMHCEKTMDCLDEMGMLVFDETRWFESTEESLEQLRVLVMRDRNRPSVVFWSTGNEEYYQRKYKYVCVDEYQDTIREHPRAFVFITEWRHSSENSTTQDSLQVHSRTSPFFQLYSPIAMQFQSTITTVSMTKFMKCIPISPFFHLKTALRVQQETGLLKQTTTEESETKTEIQTTGSWDVKRTGSSSPKDRTLWAAISGIPLNTEAKQYGLSSAQSREHLTSSCRRRAHSIRTFLTGQTSLWFTLFLIGTCRDLRAKNSL